MTGEPETRGRGRPTKYDPSYAELARNYCLLGATNPDLARMFDVSVTTIDNWLVEHPQFLGAVKEGREEADAKVARSLYERATGYKHPAVKIFMPANSAEPVYAPYEEHYPPDTAAAFIWLKNRRATQWRDKQEVEHTASDDLIAALDARKARARDAQ